MPLLADAYCEQGDRHLQSGENLLAYDVLAEGVRSHPTHVRLRQRLALAMARAGAVRDANALLRALAKEGHADEETLGLLARTHKDIALADPDPDIRNAHLELALFRYEEAYRGTAGYWSGINAATMAALLDRRELAQSIAIAVRDQCLVLLDNDLDRTERYWVLATLGEAALVRRQLAEAEGWYRKAADTAAGRFADMATTKRNARLILSHFGIDAAPIAACFRVPPVVVFAGHLIDRPERQVPRFPPGLETAARTAIDRAIATLRPSVGFASAGCGGDILFLEAVERAGGAINIVLPYNREQFRADSVDLVPGSDWSSRYDRILEHAAQVTFASEYPIGGDMSFEYGFRLLDGSACVRADELDAELVCLALWDGGPGDGRGGTAFSIDHWRRSGRTLEVIDLNALRGGSAIELTSPRAAERDVEAASTFDREIVGMLFADAKGFSRLTEPEIPLFVQHFLGTVADVIARAPSAPLQVNTWGDGLFLVFDSVAATGAFALALSDAVREIEWKERGFRDDLSVRIGLHAGPAYVCTDPVTGRRNYLGAHVSRAARIEPIAPPGEVYASGAFAALARADRVEEFRCAYVGQTPLAKGYGAFPTYVVRRNV